MPTFAGDPASSRFRWTRVLHGALAGTILASSLVAYGGCSSSSPTPTPDDSGTGQSQDSSTSTADSTVPANDSGSSVDTNAPPVDSGTANDSAAGDGGADAGEDAPVVVDCTMDDAGGGLTEHLECSGLYSDWATKTVASDNVLYTPGYVFWSDNANKNRWLHLPPGTQIDTTDMDNWVFPVGTRVFKEFSLGPLRIETRTFLKTGPGVGDWSWATYRWSADGESSATKLDTGETNVNGTSYQIPALGQCTQCHGGRPDMLLGIDAINLGASTASGVTLAYLIGQNAFTTNPPSSIEIPEDSTGKARATFGWLHTNCGIACHNSNPGAIAEGTGLFLKTSAAQLIADDTTPLTAITPYVTAVNVVPNMMAFAMQGYRRIYPGNPALSLIPTLDGSRGNPNIPQMPPIISHIVDTADVGAMKDWITAMPIPDGGPIGPDAGSDAGVDGSTDAAVDGAQDGD
jgi:hypothetical protein